MVLPLTTLALLAVGPAAALPRPPFEAKLGDWSPEQRDYCASSGLRIVAMRDGRAPVTAVVTIVDAGAADDPPGKEGLAHLVEHLWFRSRATQTLSVGDALAGSARNNAFTEPDVTVFETETVTDLLPRVLAVEGRRLTDPLLGIDEAVFAAEREVVAAELRGNWFDAEGALSEYLFPRLFHGEHPYARVGSSSPATLATITLADAQAFTAQWYRPENASLHLVGNLTPEAARMAVWRAFPDPAIGVPTGTPDRGCASFASKNVPVPLVPLARDILIHKAPVLHRRLVASWAVPGGWTAGSLAQASMAVALNGQLYSAYGEDLTRVLPACSRSEYREAAVVNCSVELTDRADVALVKARLTDAIRHLDQGTDRAIFGPFFTRALLSRFGAIVRDAEAMVAPLDEGSNAPFISSHMQGDTLYHQSVWAALGDMKFEDVVPYAEHWFTPERTVWSLIEPGAPVDGNVGPAHAASPGLTSGDALTATEVEAATALPNAGKIVARTLPNGLKIVMLPFGELPLLGMDVRFAGGGAAGSTPGELDVALARQVWRAANVGVDVNEDSLRAALTTWNLNDGDSIGWRYEGPSGNLAEMLWLLESRLRGTTVQAGSNDVAQRLGEGLDGALASAPSVLALLTWRALFPEPDWIFPAGYHAWHVALNAPERRGRELLRGLRQPENTTLLLVGKLDPVATEAAITEALGRWPVPKAAVPTRAWTAPAVPEGGETLTLASMVAASNVRVMGACRVRGSPGAPGARVIARLADVALFATLRDQAALAYDPAASLAVDTYAGNVLQLQVRVEPGAAPLAIAAMRTILHDLAALEDDGMVRRGALATGRSEAIDRATIRGMLGQLWTAAQQGDPSVGFSSRAAAFAQVDAAQVRALLAECPGHARWAVAGDVAQLKPAFEKLGVPIAPFDYVAWRKELTGKERLE